MFCQPSGRVYTATFLYWFSEQGPGRVVWRPVTTYFGPVPSHSAERVDIFDRAGRLIEHVFVDRQARKVEFYSTASRLTGRGALDVASGLVERFSVEGARQGSLLLPLPPEF